MKAFDMSEQHTYFEAEDELEAYWTHYENPDEEKIKFLQGYYDIPIDFITDSLDEFEVPRHENYHSDKCGEVQLFLLVYSKVKLKHKNYTEYETLPLSIILLNDKVVTVCKETPDFLQRIYTNQVNVAKDLLPNEENVYTPLIFNILWEVTNQYIDNTVEIDEVTEQFERQVAKTTKSSAFNKLISIQKSLVYFQTAIKRNHEVINQISAEDLYVDYDFTEELLHDVKVISDQAEVMITQSNDKVTHLSEIFSSVISHNLNNLMKFLSTISIVIAVPSIVSELWGMNVPVPFEDSPIGFPILVTAAIGMMVVIGVWLFNKDNFN